MGVSRSFDGLTSFVLLPNLWLKNKKTTISVSLLVLSGCDFVFQNHTCVKYHVSRTQGRAVYLSIFPRKEG